MTKLFASFFDRNLVFQPVLQLRFYDKFLYLFLAIAFETKELTVLLMTRLIEVLLL
jgi:hypothetical protein